MLVAHDFLGGSHTACPTISAMAPGAEVVIGGEEMRHTSHPEASVCTS
jgi:hypothetical protein